MSYIRTFSRMGLKAIPMLAETGPIGGELSHEFIILADTGESSVFCHRSLMDRDIMSEGFNYQADLQPVVDSWTAPYAATDEKHDQKKFEEEVAKHDRIEARGIEVGHIFFFGTKYSEKLGAYVTNQNGESVPAHMGSYGIGVSRLAGAIIEANHDESGIIWPESVSPFHIGLINLKVGDSACGNQCENIYGKLQERNIEVLYDDRDERTGIKFAEMELIGLPWQLVVGPRSLARGMVEVRNRRSGNMEEMTIESALSKITGN